MASQRGDCNVSVGRYNNNNNNNGTGKADHDNNHVGDTGSLLGVDELCKNLIFSVCVGLGAKPLQIYRFTSESPISEFWRFSKLKLL